MALVSSFLPKAPTMLQTFSTKSEPSCNLKINKKVGTNIIYAAKKGPSKGSGGQTNRVLTVTDRSLKADQFVVGRRNLNNNINGEDGREANAGNISDVNRVSTITNTADATD